MQEWCDAKTTENQFTTLPNKSQIDLFLVFLAEGGRFSIIFFINIPMFSNYLISDIFDIFDIFHRCSDV